jgi:peptidoglycan hydrolase-like protein with peptidoglycan-binding domain
MPSLNILTRGRSDLPGPLAQLGLGRDGTYFVIAAGRANHAGKGSFHGVADRGNQNFIGIEAENTGLDDDPWPAVQTDAYHRGVAAILAHIKQGVEFCIGHKEYAPGRKTDPSFDMTVFRSSVAAMLNGTAPPVVLIPGAEPPTNPGAPSGRPTLRRGAQGGLVRLVQARVGIGVDGEFGPKTEAAVRAFQRTRDLIPDGIVGPKTWRALDTV